MPLCLVRTASELQSLFPTLRQLYLNNDMINICKMYHREQVCNERAQFALCGRHPNLHIIYVNDWLGHAMRFIINYLIEKYPGDDEDPDDENNFVDCIMMCPACGTRFADKNIRFFRSS